MDRPTASKRTRPNRTRARPLIAVGLVLLLVTSSLLSGCMDVIFPQREEIEEVPDDGLLRVWVATRPGGISNEFVHYNLTFGGVWHGRDLLLEDLVLMDPKEPHVDLVQLEDKRQAVQVASMVVPDGEYSGFAFNIDQATLGVERVVGNANGRAITEIQENALEHSGNVVTLRAFHVVFGGKTTDLFIEIDLQRSLYRGDGGSLVHSTVPAGVSVNVDDKKVDYHPMDGGASQTDPDSRGGSRDRDDQGAPPNTALQIMDPETDARLYFDRTQPNKRMSQAVGLTQDLRFDASDSVSSYIRPDREKGTALPVPIVEHHWDFGDGTTMTGARVTKNYTQGGMFDVTLTIRDDKDNVARDHVSLFVPYNASQVVETRDQSADGRLLLGTSDLPEDPLGATQDHEFSFPPELDDGALRLGGYRVGLTTQDPTGGDLVGLMSTRLTVDSGHFQAEDTQSGVHHLQTAGVPVWRGPLSSWVEDEIRTEVQLMTGALVDYEIHVQAQYYHNLSRGRDPHSEHVHGSWPFGPNWKALHWDGTPGREEE